MRLFKYLFKILISKEYQLVTDNNLECVWLKNSMKIIINLSKIFNFTYVDSIMSCTI